MKVKEILAATLFILLSTLSQSLLAANPQKVTPGIEVLMSPDYQSLIKGKRVGLITNQTGVTSALQRNYDFIRSYEKPLNFKLVALFAPEHGIHGAHHASEAVGDVRLEGIPVYSLHGKHRRPTREMLKNIDILIFDIQDIGSRSYTYISTLFYAMEEAAKYKIPVIVADRPNPINGIMVDGPMLEEKWRSFVGYINVPYCHGMTAGELAAFFNKEYNVKCPLYVVPMKGWKRTMTFQDTALPWVPTSPNIPEPTTTFYYPMTGIIGELQLVNIGVGFTMPFKVIGAPWIDGEQLAYKLNQQNLPGVKFYPFYYKPYYGKYAKEACQGVMIAIDDPFAYRPIQTQYMVIGLLKSLYPKDFENALKECRKHLDLFNKVNGTELVYHIISSNPYPGWALREVHEKERKIFLKKRKKYLNPLYN